ncbi:MAG: spermidine synthase [Pseudomonadota bacterium]
MTELDWFAERCGDNHTVHFRLNREIYRGRSSFQTIDILDTAEYGRMLFLDGLANSSERDEFIYHEALVHPAMLAQAQPRSVCVIGGAEGATVREVLRHPSVTRVVMADIDEMLVDLCREHLPEWSQGAFEDPRLELHFTDGRKFLETTTQVFDVILVDLSDPVPDSPSLYLFTAEFYRLVHDRLSETGTACFHAGSLVPWRTELHARMFNTLATVFPVTLPYSHFTPCFHEPFACILASKGPDPRGLDLSAQSEQRGLNLRYLSPKLLQNLFVVPGYVEKAYKEFSQNLTDQNPILNIF